MWLRFALRFFRKGLKSIKRPHFFAAVTRGKRRVREIYDRARQLPGTRRL